MLPNLIGIGAMKAGTSSLHRYLALHPEVQMAEMKETHYFVGPGSTWDRGRDWYESLFWGDEPVHGEISPSYAAYPQVPLVPERMAALVPRAKLIYMVRDPIRRLLSDYQHNWGRGYEPRALEDLLSDPGLPASGYVTRSRYFAQIERYLRFYAPESILVVPQEDLLSSRREALTRVFRFLGVAENFTHEAFDRRFQVARDHRLQRWTNRAARRLGRSARNPIRADRFVELVGRVPGGRRLRALTTSPLEAPELKPRLRERLQELFADDAAALRRFTGERLESWSV